MADILKLTDIEKLQFELNITNGVYECEILEKNDLIMELHSEVFCTRSKENEFRFQIAQYKIHEEYVNREIGKALELIKSANDEVSKAKTSCVAIIRLAEVQDYLDRAIKKIELRNNRY